MAGKASVSEVIQKYNSDNVIHSLSIEEQNTLKQIVIEAVKRTDQIDIPVDQYIHAGVYVRTVKIPAGLIACGAFLKVPTSIIISGNCTMSMGDKMVNVDGYKVLKGEAGRRQVFRAIEDTYITMFFRTDAKTTEEAEMESTDEYRLLTNHRKELLNSE